MVNFEVGIQGSLRRLLHPLSSDSAEAVNPLLDSLTTEQKFACRQPCFAKQLCSGEHPSLQQLVANCRRYIAEKRNTKTCHFRLVA